MCHDPQTVARRHLVVTPYEADGENKMVPQIPDTCPLGMKDGRPCRLFLDHRRSRKTGPLFSLDCIALSHARDRVYALSARLHALGAREMGAGGARWRRVDLRGRRFAFPGHLFRGCVGCGGGYRLGEGKGIRRRIFATRVLSPSNAIWTGRSGCWVSKGILRGARPLRRRCSSPASGCMRPRRPLRGHPILAPWAERCVTY